MDKKRRMLYKKAAEIQKVLWKLGFSLRGYRICNLEILEKDRNIWFLSVFHDGYHVIEDLHTIPDEKIDELMQKFEDAA